MRSANSFLTTTTFVGVCCARLDAGRFSISRIGRRGEITMGQCRVGADPLLRIAGQQTLKGRKQNGEARYDKKI
jgi:hypothetical protein